MFVVQNSIFQLIDVFEASGNYLCEEKLVCFELLSVEFLLEKTCSGFGLALCCVVGVCFQDPTIETLKTRQPLVPI